MQNFNSKNRLVAALFCLLPSVASAQLVNPAFEEPRITVGTGDFSLEDAGDVPGWETTAGDNLIEIWSDGFGGFASFDFDQHVELNANEVSTLFQDLAGVPANRTVGFQFAHRGRQGTDTIRLTITDLGPDGMAGGGDDTVLFTEDYSTGNTDWAVYDSIGEATITTLGNTMRMAFQSVAAAGGNQAQGNFLDAVDFGIGIARAPAAMVPVMNPLWLTSLALLLPAAGALFGRRRQRSP